MIDALFWIAVAAGSLVILLLWACLVLAGRADARQHAPDEHAEFLGTGGAEFIHHGSVIK